MFWKEFRLAMSIIYKHACICINKSKAIMQYISTQIHDLSTLIVCQNILMVTLILLHSCIRFSPSYYKYPPSLLLSAILNYTTFSFFYGLKSLNHWYSLPKWTPFLSLRWLGWGIQCASSYTLLCRFDFNGFCYIKLL